MSDDWDDVHGQDATPVEETMVSNILAQRKRIEEYEQALVNMQREYDKRGKRIRELEAQLSGEHL